MNVYKLDFEKSIVASLILMTFIYSLFYLLSLVFHINLAFITNCAIATYAAYAVMAYLYYAFIYGKDDFENRPKLVENTPLFVLGLAMVSLLTLFGFLWH